LAVGAIEPKFYANLCRLLGCQQWADHQLDDESQDKIRADFRAAFATRGRDQWVAALAAADTCVTPVLGVDEVVDDDQYAARHAFVEAVAPTGERPADGAIPDHFRQVAPLMAGMSRPEGPVVAGDPTRTDTDRLLCAAGLDADHIDRLRQKGVVG
jgi:alpha-methylacyl-CoA racemase